MPTEPNEDNAPAEDHSPAEDSGGLDHPVEDPAFKAPEDPLVPAADTGSKTFTQ